MPDRYRNYTCHSLSRGSPSKSMTSWKFARLSAEDGAENHYQSGALAYKEEGVFNWIDDILNVQTPPSRDVQNLPLQPQRNDFQNNVGVKHEHNHHTRWH